MLNTLNYSISVFRVHDITLHIDDGEDDSPHEVIEGVFLGIITEYMVLHNELLVSLCYIH